jgi:toxin FitB
MRLYDTNLLIYSCQPNFTFLQADMLKTDAYISVISKLEVLGFPNITQVEKAYFQRLFTLIKILPIDDAIIDEAISLRQMRKMSLGDSIIAATANINQFNILTRNTRDFQWISNLTVINPLDI